VPTLPTPIQLVLEFLARAIKQEEEIKGVQIGKEIVKLSLFADNMIVYLKEPKNSIPKLLDIRNSFSNVARYKINLQKFFYTTMNKLRKNIGKQFHLNSLKKIKYIRVNLMKDVNYLYKENYKPLKKEIEEDYRT
jgi:hypothetical protein